MGNRFDDHDDDDELSDQVGTFASYREMPWSTDHDECERGCGVTMAEGLYVEGRLGHYCSTDCRDRSEQRGDTDAWLRQQERRQMGIPS